MKKEDNSFCMLQLFFFYFTFAPAKEPKDLNLIVHNALLNQDCKDFIKLILEETGCFDRSICYEKYKQYYLQGRKSIGNYILELIRICDFESYTEIQKERKD